MKHLGKNATNPVLLKDVRDDCRQFSTDCIANDCRTCRPYVSYERLSERPPGGMKMVLLREAGDMGELALIKSLLEGSGIPYIVHHEHVGSLYPGVPFLSGRVLVAEAERDRAETLLSRLDLQIREATETDGN